MPNKTQEYLNLAQQTAKELTRYWENWTDYLTTASRLYKYSFADQLMIYAQRPDATACASFDIWNNRMNRYVRRGSKGIALLDQSSSVPCLHYVFDVSDTGVRRNSRDPEVWQLGPDLVQPVSEMLAREYGVYHERLSQQISDLTGKLVDSYWDNNSNDISPGTSKPSAPCSSWKMNTVVLLPRNSRCFPSMWAGAVWQMPLPRIRITGQKSIR